MKLRGIFNTDRFNNPTAKGLYGFAWGLEIIAVLLGLMISLAIFLTAYDGATQSGQQGALLNAFIAFAPFFMVALSELAKIPIAEAAFTAKRRLWQFVFGVTLLFLAVITFETVFNGLERNFTFLKYKIDDKWNQLQHANAAISDGENKIENLEQLTIDTIDQQYANRIAELTDEREATLKVINAQIDRLDAESGSQAVAELRASLKRKIAEKEAEITKGVSHGNQPELQRLTAAIDRETEDIRELRKQQRDLSKFFNKSKRTRIKNDIKAAEQRLQEYERKAQETTQTSANANQVIIGSLDKEINDLEERIGRAVGRADAEFRKKREPLEQEAVRIRAQFNSGQQVADVRRKDQIASLTNNESRIKLLDSNKDEAIAKQRGLENDINELALEVQVYRFALYLAGEREAHKLDPKYVTIVALVWFGSLSAVVALTGILLAFGAFVIEFGEAPKNRGSSTRKVIDSMRRALFSIRKLQRRERVVTKTVPKEVIVEKEVVKHVPHEVLVKEIVHVPVLVGGEHKVKTETTTTETGQTEIAKIDGGFEKPDNRNKP